MISAANALHSGEPSMSTILPTNVDDLLHRRSVESQRTEFKATWDERVTGPQVLKTICAFANDFQNLNGGYIVIGIEEQDGQGIFPPRGLSPMQLDAAQKWIRGHCNRLEPPYPPILSPERVHGRLVLVVWAPASEMRPHRAPAEDGTKSYWVRQGAETVNADRKSHLLQELMAQTAKVPWDDRRCNDAKIEDLRETKVREFLRDVRSGLLDLEDGHEICRRMRLTKRVNDHEVPRNVGLLFFSKDPEVWIRGARIEVVQFAADRAGDVQEERVFRGPLADQLNNCLTYLENLSAYHLQKQQDRPRVRGWVSYPMAALRETLVNAVYHRSYDVDQPEPIKVYLYPGRIEVTSYPGPVPGVELRDMLPNAQPKAVPARNRRIGEFLKELGLAEGRLTGLQKVFRAMEANGSPTPRFEFDQQRTYFQATLPAHPEYAALSALRDAAHLRTLGDELEALRRVESAWLANPSSAILATEVIRSFAADGKLEQAEQALATFEKQGHRQALPHVRNALIDALMDAGETGQALRLLEAQQHLTALGQDAMDAAILARRGRQSRLAHRFFERAGEAVQADPRALLEFAQTKLRLANEAHKARHHDSNRRLLAQARELLERVLQLPASRVRHAWAWREMARTLNWQKAPIGDAEDAYRKAIELLPEEPRFVRELEQLRNRRAQSVSAKP